MSILFSDIVCDSLSVRIVIGSINFVSLNNVANLTRVNYNDFSWHTTPAGPQGGKPRCYLTAASFREDTSPPPTLWVTTGLVLDSFLTGRVRFEGHTDTTYEKGIGIHLPSREFGRYVSILQKLMDTPEIWLPTSKIELDTNPNVKQDALVFAQFPSLYSLCFCPYL